MSDRQERLLGFLAERDGWVTAAQLADHLGVTTRSVRSYVTAVKASASPLDVIASSTSGYRLNRALYARFLGDRQARPDGDTPRDRLYHVLRSLGDAPDGIDLFALAESLFVSESTIESDLRKLRAELAGSGLVLSRQESTVHLAGSEQDLRRVLSRLFREEGAHGFLELESIEREFSSTDLAGFKTALIEMLDSHGYFVNEYGINNVILHVAIAVDRKRKGQLAGISPAGRAGDAGAEVAAELAVLVENHFAERLADGDIDYLALLLTTRVVTRGETGAGTEAPNGVERELAIVGRIVARVGEEYLVDLDDTDFMMRLALHVSNLIARAKDKSYSRNPMTRSIKTAYPVIYEIAVFMASELQREAGIAINDDEISYIALHVGAYLERESRREERVTCAIVCPGYYDMHLVLRERLEAALGSDLQVDIVITRTDVDWSALQVDLVLTTIPASAAFPDGVVVIQPFLTGNDVDAIRRAISRVRRQSRRMRLKDDLLEFFDESLYLRNFQAADESAMIEALGERMRDAGLIDEGYVDGALERERMSSTAFTDTLAVPHAMAMTARRTAICIAVNEASMVWGENRVNVIALVAFSASDRTRFQSVFDQFVAVFADRDEVQHLIQQAVDFPAFIDALVHGIDK